ncbi:alpha/beta fold hydrolase [Metapseudomonas resinovorans]|uniref:alpha/beta fold hydrolase n=1 Tax=Metapseudomonas resinovorans TaxID=53412 RepID=UPI000415AB28|nr:alpha/beta hydrolase [Pseudomonas resinovorans]MDE3738152.1 alpha/beta hydrolase [Pseudomonas resinovorans]
MPPLEHRLLQVNGITLSLYMAGPSDGRPVWLLHGFPECWYSWRQQIGPLVASGYRVLVPEMRGYGQSSAPEAVEDYALLTLCADIQAAMDSLGQEDACVVGHDWGAPVAWHLALLEPQRIRAVGALSVPFGGRPKRPAIEIMREANAGRFNYILYFQEPGVAEAELDADLDRSLRLLLSDLGDALLRDKPADARLLDGLDASPALPGWCDADEFAFYQRTLAEHGFRGPLNWYRNFTRNWQQTEHLAGRQVEQPTLFMVGDHDPVARLEAYTLKRMADLVPRLEQHRLPDCGHWLQNERPAAVNERLLDFLARHYPA